MSREPSIIEVAEWPVSFVEHRVSRWDGFEVALMRAHQDRTSEFVRRRGAHALFFNLGARSIPMESRIDGGPARWSPLVGKAWTLIPAGATLRGVLRETRAFDHLSIAIAPAALEALADHVGRRPARALLVPRLGCSDAALVQSAHKLAAALRIDGAIGRMYAAQLCDLIATELLIAHCADAATAEARRGGFGPAPLRRVLGYLDAHVTSDPDPAEAIALSGVSRGHFFRAFRQSTGVTPERYLTERRIERAKALFVLDPALAAQVAASQVGLGSARRLRAAFLRVTGVSLEAFRRDLR